MIELRVPASRPEPPQDQQLEQAGQIAHRRDDHRDDERDDREVADADHPKHLRAPKNCTIGLELRPDVDQPQQQADPDQETDQAARLLPHRGEIDLLLLVDLRHRLSSADDTGPASPSSRLFLQRRLLPGTPVAQRSPRAPACAPGSRTTAGSARRSRRHRSREARLLITSLHQQHAGKDEASPTKQPTKHGVSTTDQREPRPCAAARTANGATADEPSRQPPSPDA